MEKMEFKDNIARIRKSQMLSVEEASNLLDMPTDYLGKIEEGKVVPKMEDIKAFIRVYKVGINDLIDNTELDEKLRNTKTECNRKKSKTIFWCGLLSILLSVIIIGLPFGIYGLILGSFKKGKINRKGKLGIVLAVIGIVISAILLSALVSTLIL